MKTKIVIECAGGVVAAVYSNSAKVEITLVDWDEINEGGLAERMAPVALTNIPGETKALLK